jgi:AcrR family transcriptional regulator
MKPESQPRKTPRQERAKKTVSAILRAAGEVLTEEGYQGASTNKIARRAGVSIGTLYEYFPNKEVLVAALIERYAELARSVMRARFAEVMDRPFHEAASSLLHTLVDQYRLRPELSRVLVEQIPSVGDTAKLQEIYDDVAALVCEYLEAHRAELRLGDFDHQTWIFTTTASQLAERIGLYCPEGLDADRLVDEAVAMLTAWLVADRT